MLHASDPVAFRSQRRCRRDHVTSFDRGRHYLRAAAAIGILVDAFRRVASWDYEH